MLCMRIGVLREVKIKEGRVALTPAAAKELINLGNEVFVERNAGLIAGFLNKDYEDVGAVIADKERILSASKLILKVKEPTKEEYTDYRSDQIVFTYLHLASNKILTEFLLRSKATYVAYETIETADKKLPLLIPMSQIAGKLSIHEGARLMRSNYGGPGILLSGVTGVSKPNVTILGAGVVGTEAATLAAAMGANVQLLDINLDRLRYLESFLPRNIELLTASQKNIKECAMRSDLLIGAVLVPGGKTPILVGENVVKRMKKNAVIIDVAVDQGGCIETSRVTNFDNPTYELDGVIHYGVANMPGSVPRTATEALVNATLPYIKKITEGNLKQLLLNDIEIQSGVNIYKGNLVNSKVAEALGLPFKDLKILTEN